MNIYVPGEIYKNVVEMIGYRNAIVTVPILSSANFVSELTNDGYVSIYATRKDDPIRGSVNIIAVIVAPGGEYATKVPKFRQLYNKLILKNTKSNDNGTEFIIISEKIVTVHIVRAIAEYKIENPKIVVETYEYSRFMMVQPKHWMVPKHELMPNSEIDQICKQFNFTRDSFPKITQSDASSVWLGIKVGMLVKITRVSETAGTSITYRICKGA